ncbi:uncharacterized protein LOC141649501 [Silene latifolia]|uniref:uncharacterized protein LOC141649501 n=1 Tax=Silene latifolia TaxID=37657 RepID=UPI003D776E8E
MMKVGYTDGHWTADPRGYSFRNGYEWLRMQQPKQDWVSVVWSKWNIPKHALIFWIIMNNGLNVKEKLCKIGYCIDDRCLIYDSYSETQEHLSFNYRYSQQILQQMELWCGFSLQVKRSTGALPPKVCLKQKVHYLVLAACYYQVWTQRNNARMNHVLLKPDKVTEHIIDEVRSRIRRKLKEPVSSSDKVWLAKWGML